ncbi:MAG: hypothetical protein KA155_08525 [Alphaproteobacteria bacterium]|jgi:hypothetical protein|nr:hypothetical protein [Alphaproteobacteria bacterium]
MSCNETKKGKIEFDGDCKCQNAVMRAYKGLLTAGTPESRALEAAKIVYSHHHPEDPADIAALTVERWVNAGHFH